MKPDILQGYADAACDEFIARLDAISTVDLLAPFTHHFPTQRSDILDIGAGTGRDAAWLAARGHCVTAVEPVDALRNAGIARHTGADIAWISDTLPDLAHTLSLGRLFDLILLCGVWQHLDSAQRQRALPVLHRLTAGGGTVVMSIRHGEGAPARPVFPAAVNDTVRWASGCGFRIIDEITTASVQTGNQKAGVTWTWLVLQSNKPTA